MDSPEDLDGCKYFLTTVLDAVSLLLRDLTLKRQEIECKLEQSQKSLDMQQKIHSEQVITISSLNKKLGKIAVVMIRKSPVLTSSAVRTQPRIDCPSFFSSAEF